MERLTIKYEGLFTPKKACTIDCFGEADDCDSCDVICDSTHGSDCANCVIQECFTRLGEYENTGFTPPEIMELKERDTAKEIQKVEEQPYFRKHFHSYICPVCHKKVEFGWLFCGHCGQKLKRKD